MVILYGIRLTMFGKLYRRLTSLTEERNNPQVTNGSPQAGEPQAQQQQDQCEPPQEREPKGNGNAVQLEVCSDAPLC